MSVKTYYFITAIDKDEDGDLLDRYDLDFVSRIGKVSLESALHKAVSNLSSNTCVLEITKAKEDDDTVGFIYPAQTLCSEYDPSTGLFGDWRGEISLLNKTIERVFTAFNNSTQRAVDINEDNLLSNSLRVITPNGEKPIFALDDENILTECGQSLPILNAIVRSRGSK
tara:strand:- start:217 stop:723 length:507 start_codon:yes stop_codon:yes gene_type:complete